MTTEEIKKEIEQRMIEGIQAVLQGKQDEADLLYCRPADVERYLVSIGVQSPLDEFETNGWQWDYWAKIIIGENTYMLCGDGYYGDGATFSIEK
jgi:hypothetical protein